MKMGDDPFEGARRRARAAGSCPVEELEGFYAEHAAADELCGMFACGECVAGGWGGPGARADPAPETPPGARGGDGVPF